MTDRANLTTPARVAQQVAIVLQVGPLAAAGSAMGPLSYRVGFRGGPQSSPSDAGLAASKLAERVALGAIAVLAANDLAYAAAATQLRYVVPVHTQIVALVRRGAALSPLGVCLLAALETARVLGKGAGSAALLCAQLNRAASDRAPATYSVAQVAAELEALKRAALA